jgi:tetratricopeptide (TPR) repeat protein
MLGDFGEVLVMDWGLAKKFGPLADSIDSEVPPAPEMPLMDGIDYRTEANTMTGAILGTPQYMPPEQAKGQMEALDERADIYALGAILYHTLALQPPVFAESAEQLLQKVISGEIAPPTAAVRSRQKQHATGGETQQTVEVEGEDEDTGDLPHLPAGKIPASLEAVVLKAMSHDLNERYATVAALQKDISAYQNGFATAAEHAGLLKLLYLFIKRHRTISVAASLALILTAGFAVQLAREGERSARALSRLGSAAPLFFENAKTQFHANHPDLALERVDFALEFAPQNPDYLRLRALILQRLGRATEAEAASKKAAAADSSAQKAVVKP